MANSITFTSHSFVDTTLFATASAATASGYIVTTTNTFYDISGTSSYDRWIYGLGITSTDTANIQTITIALNDGTKDIRLYQGSCPVNSGNTTPLANYDIFNITNSAPIFSGQSDGNGVNYFNLKAGWSLKASYGTTLTTNRLLIFTLFGETYK